MEEKEEKNMNKKECKKYVKRAFKRIIETRKNLTPENIEIEIMNSINDETEIYASYGKIAMYNLKNSATVITAEQLERQIDIIPTIYKTQSKILEKAKQI